MIQCITKIKLNTHALKLFSQKFSESLTGIEPGKGLREFLREQLESVRIKNIITKLPETHQNKTVQMQNRCMQSEIYLYIAYVRHVNRS